VVKSLIQQCSTLEKQTNSVLPTFEKQHLLESLRQDRLRGSTDLMRELEYSAPDKLKHFYVYKVKTMEEYLAEQREIRD
jgi:hypothetical protein